MTNQVTNAETANSAWKSLYRVGGAAALIVAVLLPVEIIVFTAYPLPSTVIGYFALFQSNRLIPAAVLLLLFLAMASCSLLLIWYILIARRLYQLGRLE